MIICLENYKNVPLGAKAGNLFLLAEAGFLVPSFFCVDQMFREREILDYLSSNFPDTASFSVRSCASLEDSADLSFAGQFRTFLRVPQKEVCARIRDVLSDAERPEIFSGFRIHGMKPKALTMHVIVQEMVEPDLSGVLFTANPQGILNETVIVCGRGSGDLVVEDRTDTTTTYYNLSDRTCYYEQTGASPLLTDRQIEELIRSSREIRAQFSQNYKSGKKAGIKSGRAFRADSAMKSDNCPEAELDMEFAIRNNKIYFLQVRPVTTFDTEAPVIILDNSNIVESYPGITLPLTQSFIRDAYYQVFRSLLLRLTGEPDTVEKIDGTLRQMVDTANGRIYYRISNWYDVLLFLPFHRRLIPIWQEMMGVKNKTVSSALRGQIRRTTRLKVALSFLRLLLTCPREMTKLDQYFREITRRFDGLDTDVEDNRILLGYYHELLHMTVKKWDITLANDMYCFLFTGLLKAGLKARRVPNSSLAANRAISGIRKLESMHPIEALQKLAAQAREEDLLDVLGEIDTNEAFFGYIKNNDSAFCRALQTYIREFGDRNTEELKLESKTFRTDPVLLIRCILQYAAPQAGAAVPKDTGVSDSTTPSSASAPPHLTGFPAFFAGRAAAGIRNREKSRLHRARLYGMMRSLVLRMGKNLYAAGRIEAPDDIFWLYCEEIERAASDNSLGLRRIVSERKTQYESFSRLPACSRLVFSGKVRDKVPKGSRKMTCEAADGVYRGTPCSSGVAEGEVLVIEQPSPDIDTKDRILVTKMTDPGWVFLIARARAIVSEKGSLLSHTAIIARELGKPAVVGLEQIADCLKTGDRVLVDGDRGTVTILSAMRPGFPDKT